MMNDKEKIKEIRKDRFVKYIGFYIIFIAVVLGICQLMAYKGARDTYVQLKMYATSGEDDGFTVDWEKFKDTDVVAWIRFKNDPQIISYPIVQGKTNRDYLRKLYTGESNICGSLFLNSHNKRDFSDPNSIIYGHNMLDGSMFHDLRYYEEKSYWEINKTFYLYFPDGTRHEYTIFSVANVFDKTATYDTYFLSVEDYQKWLEERVKESLFKTGVEVDTNHKVVTLSTCSPTGSHQGHRRVLYGVETKALQIQEPASWYK